MSAATDVLPIPDTRNELDLFLLSGTVQTTQKPVTWGERLLLNPLHEETMNESEITVEQDAASVKREKRRQYLKAYRQRPEVKAKRAAERNTPQMKAWKAEYYKKMASDPAFKEAKKKYSAEYWTRPEVKARVIGKHVRPERKEQVKKYAAKNKGKLKEYLREYHQKRMATPEIREKKREYDKQYNASPIGRAVLTNSRHIRRAKIKGTAVRATAREIRDLRENATHCHYCQSFFDGVLIKTIDHVLPISRGGDHSMANLVVACKPCNSQKQAATPEEWAARREKIFLAIETNCCDNHNSVGGPKPPDAKPDQIALPGSQPGITV